MSIEAALDAGLEAIRARDAQTPPAQSCGITIAWTTWAEIADTVRAALREFDSNDAEVNQSVRRQAVQLLDAIAFHG